MEAVEVDCNIDVHDVAVLQRSAVCCSAPDRNRQSEEKGLNSSGMPCTRILLTLVQHDLGNPLYRRGEGYAPFLRMNSCTPMSTKSVGFPGYRPQSNPLPPLAAECTVSRTGRELSPGHERHTHLREQLRKLQRLRSEPRSLPQLLQVFVFRDKLALSPGRLSIPYRVRAARVRYIWRS